MSADTYDAGGWGYYANAIAGKIGAVLFAGCVAGVEGESKDEQEELREEIATTGEHGLTRTKRQKDRGKKIRTLTELPY
jgi:hypothetical protein